MGRGKRITWLKKRFRLTIRNVNMCSAELFEDYEESFRLTIRNVNSLYKEKVKLLWSKF